MKKLAALAVLTMLTGAARANPPHKGATVEGITQYDLDNGLRVLIFPDASKPTMTVNLTVLVGSRMEGYGETGMAHLLEHMVYKGTPTHPKIMDELTQHGAQFNGSTSFDRTNYFETFPASDDNLKWALGLESDRLVHSNVLKKDLDTEFSVVRNEFERGENSPHRVLLQRMMASAFEWHNYGKSTIGSRADIEKVPIDALQSFYHRFYQPDNAILVVAGKIDPQKALAMVADSFGKLPRPTRTLAKTYTTEPVQDGEHVVTVHRTGDMGLVGAVYHGVAGADADFVAEEALADILAHKPAGRLYKALVDKGLASSVNAWADSTAEPGALTILAEVPAGKPLEPVRDQIAAVTESLGKTKIGDDELARFKTAMLREIDLGLTDSASLGVELSEWAAQGDWRLIFLHRDAVKALTADRVQKFAANYFKASNRTVGLFIPEKNVTRAPLPSSPDVAAMVKSYKGQEQLAAGEAFAATIPNIDKRTERVTLPGGMKLALLQKKTRGESVKMVLQVNVGSEPELRGSYAAAKFLPEMLGRGSKKHTYQQFRDALDTLKVELHAMSMADEARPGESLFMATTVRASLPAFLSLVTEMLREPTFSKDEFESLKKEKIARLEEQLQQPQALAMQELMAKARPWPKDDPRHRRSLQEMLDAYKAVKVEDLSALYKKLWGASSAELVLVGDFDSAAVKAQLGKELATWKSPRPFKRIEIPYHAPEVVDDLIVTPDKQMAMVGIAEPLELREDDGDYPALHLANYVFGGNTKSRLWDRLRQKEGYSYGTGSQLRASASDRNSTFFAMAICAPQNAGKAMTALLDELSTFIHKGVGADELKNAKASFQAEWETNLADDDAVARMLQESLYLERPLAFYDKLMAGMHATTAEQMSSALAKYVKPDQLVKVKAGDIKN